jgi:histidinol-phosphate aminotransferase
MALTPKPGVLEIAPYVGGRSESESSARVFKLSSNESALGPSPKAIEAFRSAQSALNLYPDGSVQVLRDAIARTYGLAPERIVCGNGSDELITLLANCYLRPGDEVLFTKHSFLVYRIAALANSAMPVEVAEPELKADVDAMLARVSPRTRLVYLANPNNPTGSYLPAAELRRLHAGLPREALFVIDSAYAEYVRRNDYESGIELVATSDNVVMTRTFSKVYGLAGLRVGWAYCPAHVADALNRVRGPFNVNVAAQKAALAALEDRAFTDEAVRYNETWRDWLIARVRELGLRADTSAGNFVLIHFSSPQHAHEADSFLMARGLILRPTGGYKLPHCLRITVGTEEANRLFVQVLGEFVERANKRA